VLVFIMAVKFVRERGLMLEPDEISIVSKPS